MDDTSVQPPGDAKEPSGNEQRSWWRTLSPFVALLAGMLLIPMKLSELAVERQWSMSLFDLGTTLGQIGLSGWISIGVIVVEGLVAGAVFMLAISYTFNFQQNIGRIGHDVLQVKNKFSRPQSVELPPTCFQTDDDTKRWLDRVLADAKNQSRENHDDLILRLATAEHDLETARSDLERERSTKSELSSKIDWLNDALTNATGENAQRERIIALLTPIIDAVRQLGEQARQINDTQSSDASRAEKQALQ